MKQHRRDLLPLALLPHARRALPSVPSMHRFWHHPQDHTTIITLCITINTPTAQHDHHPYHNLQPLHPPHTDINPTLTLTTALATHLDGF